ncbi:hypothetical protein ACH4TX_12365 [Streptomyces sp. NPDC021098]|uniref:hypothetical protein n=1 Tax=unclassified Streptomyces TaxID=2593676 RepID=UPI0037AC794D
MKNPAQSYTAQIVSSKLSYQRPDGTPMETGRVYLKVLMVVKSADKNRPIKAPGSLQMEVRIPSWGDSPPVLEPATQYYTVDNVDAQGNGIGAGVRATLGTLNADTPYYVTFGAQLEEGDDPSGDKLCGYVEDSPECIQLGKVSPAS